jgi:hypothetical protein
MRGSARGRTPDIVSMGSFLRTPLGLFAAVVVVGLAVIMLALTEFGGTSGHAAHSPRPLTPAQFRSAGARIGRSACLQLKPIVNKKPRNLGEIASDTRRITAVFDRLTRDIDVLVPPPSAAPVVLRLRRDLGALDGAMHRAAHLAETHQWRRFVLLVRSRWFQDIGKRFGPVQKGKLRCDRARLSTA